MKGIIFDNMDIDLYLIESEFAHHSLPKLEIVDGELKRAYEPLRCRLQTMEGADSGRNAQLQWEDSEGLDDGIAVEYREKTYFVRMNEHASNLIDERGQFGTRYGTGEKITINISERSPCPL